MKNELKNIFRVKIKVNDKDFYGRGDTVESALDAIKPPEVIKTKLIFTTRYNKQEFEIFLNVFKAKRLFNSEKFRKIKTIQIEKILKRSS